MNAPIIDRILDQLPEHRDTKFGLMRLFFAERTPASGPGAGLMGVSGAGLLDAYIRGIDAACELFGGQLGWPMPDRHPEFPDRSDLEGRIPVLVFNLDWFRIRSPFTSYYDRRGFRPFIGLPSELWETTRKAVRDRARIIGAHEAAHVFTHSNVGIYDLHYDDWGWFDEATAVLTEWHLNKKSSERHRFARHWIFNPETGLEQTGLSIGYETAWFLEYLVGKHNWDLITDVWRRHRPGETPIQAIDRWFKDRKIAFRDVLHDVKDEFARGYCVERYLTANLCPRLHRRFGNRWTCCSFKPSPGSLQSHECTLGPLACRYYRVVPNRRAGAFRVEVRNELPLRRSGLKGHVFAVAGGDMLGEPSPLVASGSPSSTTTLSARIEQDPRAAYYIVSVANVLSLSDDVGNPSLPRQRDRSARRNTSSFRVEVSA